MNATHHVLLCALLAGPAAPQELVQPRIPVDVSVKGLGEAPRRAPGDAARGARAGLSARPALTPLDCAQRIADQATGDCLQASSTATLGLLFPYPGDDNVFLPPAFIGGGRGNQATVAGSTVAGGVHNTASGLGTGFPGYATVGGGRDNLATGPGATVGGGGVNAASGFFAAVGGGAQNVADARFATVAGGFFNTAEDESASVGGGGGNLASGFRARVGGGNGNRATGDAATIAGGNRNLASAYTATVAGGVYNTASAREAMIPGGNTNTAEGVASFAAGRRATAVHDGAFVWGDSQFTLNKQSSAPDEFNVYASGGVRMFTNSAATTGVLLAPGGGSWSSVSDRDAKENVEPVDGRAVLERLGSLPLSTWSYRAQDDSIRHMGPMAQDFRTAFGLGISDRVIDTIDPDGVALASIQGLHAVVREENAELRARLTEKEAQIEELRARVERLEALARGQGRSRVPAHHNSSARSGESRTAASAMQRPRRSTESLNRDSLGSCMAETSMAHTNALVPIERTSANR